MKFLRKNLKWIIAIIILIVITSGISIYATSTYVASQIEYKDGKNVAEALNELYGLYNETFTKARFTGFSKNAGGNNQHRVSFAIEDIQAGDFFLYDLIVATNSTSLNGDFNDNNISLSGINLGNNQTRFIGLVRVTSGMLSGIYTQYRFIDIYGADLISAKGYILNR